MDFASILEGKLIKHRSHVRFVFTLIFNHILDGFWTDFDMCLTALLEFISMTLPRQPFDGF